ncbi:MAG: S41 family peptidase [Planctomycetes bacterium]|nr:S41 family peptidase [Planctomycetota bacterium]
MISFSILPVIVLAGVVLLFTYGDSSDGTAEDIEGLDKDIALYIEVRQKLKAHYDGELSDEKLRNAALIGMAAGANDPYTRVLPPIESKAQSTGLSGGFYGISANVQKNDDGSVQLTRIIPGGGAEKAGLLENDVIVAVDGQTVLDQPFELTLLRVKSKEVGSVVKLSILRGGDVTSGTDSKATKLEFEVTRSKVITYSVHDAHIEEFDGRRFAYIRISGFNSNTFDPQFKNELTKIVKQGAEGVILDLRGNGGGQVGSATQVVDAFIAEKDKLIVFTKSSKQSNRNQDFSIFTKDETSITDLPLVILVDGNSASASEIVTGALRDHGRAFVIGNRTFGKGRVQTLFDLETDPNYTMNITTASYYTPLGRPVQNGSEGQLGGINPDLIIEYKSGEQGRVYNRQAVRERRYKREESAETNKWWNYEDRMINAALKVLAGKPVVIK